MLPSPRRCDHILCLFSERELPLWPSRRSKRLITSAYSAALRRSHCAELLGLIVPQRTFYFVS